MKKPSPPLKSKSLALVQRASTPWHAVSIVHGQWCCEAARDKSSQRFLSRDAPRLPLPQCAARESCRCAYKHHSDRRGSPRRQDEMIGLRRSVAVATERRVERGRREDD